MGRTLLRSFAAAGFVDSFGLALGWTVFNLHALATQGLPAVGVYNAAMLVGVGLSAPFTSWLTVRLRGRGLIRVMAGVECTLRVGTFVLALLGLPFTVIAPLVGLMSLTAWTGYAGMRGEIAEAAARERRASSLAWYAGGIAAVEAVGAAVAALLPAGADGIVGGPLLACVVAIYGLVLVPTFIVAGGARVDRRIGGGSRPRLDRRTAMLGGGFVVMLLASGPTLLVVGLTATLYGRNWVAAAAVAFTIGALLAPLLASLVDRPSLPPRVLWPLLGLGMVGGWVLAPLSPLALLFAQLLAGSAMTAFEGVMDAWSADDESRHVTAGLGWAASVRALGSAAAVGIVPVAVATGGVASASVIPTTILAGAVVACGVPLLLRRLVGRGAEADGAIAPLRS